MCYSGECVYENYDGDCRAPGNLKNPCKKGRKYSKTRIIKDIISMYLWRIQHYTRFIFSTKYRKQWRKEQEFLSDLPF